MDKPALNNYPLETLIRNRWSPRVFTDAPVEQWKICALLEAARWAPSSFNEQPWRFFVGAVNINPETHEKLASLLLPGNAWAQKAPLLMLSVAKLNFAYNGSRNRHAQHDVGLAVENLVLQAMDLGLATHQMAGFSYDKAIQTLLIPEGYEPMAAIAIGYPGNPQDLEGELRERELAQRVRQPIQDMVFSDAWENSFPVCFT